jgi:hypothetical protein
MKRGIGIMLNHSHGHKNRPYPTDNYKDPGFSSHHQSKRPLNVVEGMLPSYKGSIYPQQFKAANDMRPGIEGGKARHERHRRESY